MKIGLGSFLFAAAILIFAQFAFAGDVTLAWDPNTEPELLGYRLSYGTASGSYDTHVDVGNVTTYTVSGLTAGTYYFAVKAYSADMESAYSNEVSATVSGGGDTQPPSISNVSSSGVTSSSATIAWTTNEAANSQVEYGISTSYGSSTTLNSSMVTSHSQSLSGLTASTTYHYRVKSADAAGNLATSTDYTFTTATPPDTTAPTITNVSSSGITTTTATIAWTTNEAANSQVEYGTSTSYGSSTALNSSMVTSHSQSLSGLTASTTYHYRVKSADASGNLATSGDCTFITATPPDTTPPTITNVSNTGISSTSATITWTTNEAADSQIEYGTTTSYGSSTILNSTMLTSHSQSLSGLTASTTYHYRVKSRDAAGNLATSADYTLTTTALPDTTPPTITNVSSSGVTSSSATIAWTTNEAANSQVEYGTSTSYGSSTALNSTMLTSHSQSLSGLIASTTYHYRVKSRDAAGNLATSADYTFKTSDPPDTSPLTISNVASSSLTTTSALITWTTNLAADSEVEYGTTILYGTSTDGSSVTKRSRFLKSNSPSLRPSNRRTSTTSEFVTSHSVTLSGLTPGTTYHYRVKSRDAAGNLAISADYTFVTASAADIAEGLVAAYAFDEGAGTVSEDLSGSGNTAAVHSAGWRAGKYGNAISFNGADSYVDAGTNGLPAVNEPKTVSCWVYIEKKYTSAKTMLALANSALEASLKHGYKNSQAGVMDSGNKWTVVGKLPSLKTWHHFGYVFDGTHSNLYIDGVLVGKSTISLPDAPVTSFQIGRWIDGSEYFEGGVDDLRIYTRALTSDELTSVMNTPVAETGAAPVTEASPIADETNPPADPAEQPANAPAVDIQLEHWSYNPGDTVRTRAFWISNPSAQSRGVELKMWIALPGMSPISLGGLSVEEKLSLTPGFNQNYGSMPLLDISADAPSGTCYVGARLVNPVTGEVMSEDVQSFIISAAKDTWPRTRHAIAENPHITMESYIENSRALYVVKNEGTASADIEVKVWLEDPDGNTIQAFSIGAEGSLTLPANASITLASQQLPPGIYVIKSKIMDAASGEILLESELAIDRQ